MMLADGNASEYEVLQSTISETYLLKLENYCEKIVQQQKQLEEIKRKK